MIDPSDVTKFDRTDAELEEWWLFSTIVAGKTAQTQARLLEKFLENAANLCRYDATLEQDIRINRTFSPFQLIRGLGADLFGCMEVARIGQYTRLERCWRESLSLDLRNDPVEAFEAIHGVGPKTARMFIMHSRPNQRLAALDTHLLKHLAAHGHEVPKATPSSPKKYRELELAFLELADKAGKTPADYDLEIWKSYARK